MLNFLHTILRRPVAVFMFYLGLLILGVLSLGELDISLLPPLEYPQVTVQARYPGAMPQEVEQTVTRPLEEALSVVSGVKEVLSRSMQNEALLTVKLAWGTDMKYAALNIRQQADRVYSYFPEGALRPVVNLRSPQYRPVVTLTVSGAPKKELARFAEYVVKKRLEQIGGVAEAAVIGAPRREIHVILNPDALRRQGFSLEAVKKALRDNNIVSSGGSVKNGNFRLSLRIQSEYRSVEEIGETPVFRDGGGFFVPLKKLARVVDTIKEPESLTRVNGRPCIALDIRKESGANTLRVQKRIDAVMEQLRAAFPDVRIQTVYSQAGFIKDTLNSVVYALLAGAFLAVLVLFVFLSGWKAPLIVSVSIPVSLVAAFLWMKFSGVGINVISLAGLALGGGMLVDNSIVALENIHRYREEGKNAFQAAALGVSEVALPITASTLTTIAVFVPVLFLKDISAAVFSQQAKTVSYALIASLVVGVTLLPVVYLKLHKKDAPPARVKQGLFNRRLLPLYEDALERVLKHQNGFLLAAGLLLILALFLGRWLDRRLLPETEQHAVEVRTIYQPGVSLDYVDEKSALLETEWRKDNDVALLYAEMGKKQGVFLNPDQRKLNRSYIFMKLDRASSSDAVLKRLRRTPAAGERIEYDFRKVEPALSGLLDEKSAPLSLYIYGRALPVLDSLAGRMVKEIKRKYPRAVYNANFFERYPALLLSVDRAKLARFNLTAGDIAAVLEHTLKGGVAADFFDFDRKINIRIRAPEELRRDLNRLLNMEIKGYPLRSLVEVKRVDEISYIEHKDQYRVFRIDMRGDRLSDLAEGVGEIVKQTSLPSGYYTGLGGEWQAGRESARLLLLAFILAVLLVYLILAAQFESFKAPFIIMFTVPLALIGIVPALLITGMTLNVMSLIGLVVIVGIVVNDGIIKIDFIQRAHKNGMPVEQAVRYGGRMRFRPIIMTTLTTVIALLPLAFGIGPGADLQQPMAITIIGGETVSTLLTLFVLPVLYGKWMGKRR